MSALPRSSRAALSGWIQNTLVDCDLMGLSPREACEAINRTLLNIVGQNIAAASMGERDFEAMTDRSVDLVRKVAVQARGRGQRGNRAAPARQLEAGE